RWRAAHPHVTEHAGRDPSAGGDHGRAHKDSLVGNVAARLHIREAQDERNYDSCASNYQRFAAYADKIARAGFEPRAEKHEDSANFGNGMNRVGWDNPTQRVRSETDTGKNFAQHCGKVQALEYFSDHLGTYKDGKKLKQQLFR